MADKHNLNYDVRELKLGSSFTNNKTSQYHTIKYDFKPASVDVNKMASVDVGTNNQVTVTVPHLDGAGVPQTVFKGNQRPYSTKECVLIIDRVTGEITLEKLSSNIQVKKTRQESSTKPRPLTPVTTDFTNTTQRSTSRTRVATNRRAHANPQNMMCLGNPSAAGAGASAGAGAGGSASSAAQRYSSAPQPQSMVRSPPRVKTSPPQAAPWSGGGNSTLASLPMIGLDEPTLAAAPPRVERPERQYTDRPPTERQHIDRPTERQYTDRAPTERPYTDRAPTDRQYADRPADRQHSERPHVDRPYAERPPPERPQLERPPPPALPTLPPTTVAAEDSSSSSSSDSGSDSGSDSDSDDDRRPALPNGNNNPTLPADVLKDDLCLSESGSDSD